MNMKFDELLGLPIAPACGLLPLARVHAAGVAASAPVRGIEIAIGPMPPLLDLQMSWRALEARAEATFFVSWSWIGAWLSTLASLEQLQLVRATSEGRTVGLCVVGRRARRWRAGLSMQTLLLNATGDAVLDKITTEYNDVLCEPALAPVVRGRVVEALLQLGNGWEELQLPGVMPSGDWAVPQRLGGLVAEVREEPCHAIDLLAVRGPEADIEPKQATLHDRYLALLSSNTRAQIRRSIKEYAKLGELRLIEATTVAEAHAFLDELRDLHQPYWIARGEPGAFGHEYFGRFHRQLIADSFDRGEIQMLRLLAGDVLIGYLYNFVFDGRVMNYQSGFDYAPGGKHARPGLVMHSLAIALSTRRGAAIYDFMAGTNRTKESLATFQHSMQWFTLRRPTARYWIDMRLRAAKRAWKSATSRRAANELVDSDGDGDLPVPAPVDLAKASAANISGT
ncbi:hypothetical protein BH09PSE5_BH09PSE5_43540 [soil metagenome]